MHKPIIERWRILGVPGNYFILGDVYEDERAPHEGATIRISTLRRIDFEKGECETKNTIYRLGRVSTGTQVLNEKTEILP